MRIDRYLFVEAFAFNCFDGKQDWLKNDLKDLIPIISFEENFENFKKAYRRRQIWLKHPENFGLELKLHRFYVVRCFVNAIGLGILILPFRIAATYIKQSKIESHRYERNMERLDEYNYGKYFIPEEEEELKFIEKNDSVTSTETYYDRIYERRYGKRFVPPCAEDPKDFENSKIEKTITIKIKRVP